MSLQTHWNRLRIPVASANLPRKWAIYSLVFLLLLAMVVSILPAGDSLGFFSVLATLFGFLLSVFVFVAQLIFALLLFLFSLPFFLFGQPPPFAANPTPPAVPPLPMEPMLPTSTAALWDLIRSILLWGALIAIIVYAFARFVSQHEDLLTGLRRSRIVNWLMLAWQWLYRGVNQARGNLRSAITAGWQGLITRLGGAHADSRPGWISLRSLDPRRRVYFFYLAMIRRGGEQGLAREPSQTPSEYAARLVKAIPDAGEDVDSITEAFIEARYSRREVDFKQSHLVKAMWERIRRAMLQKRRSEKFSRKDRP